MQVLEMITHGGFYIDHEFLPETQYKILNENFYNYKFEDTYQPSGIDYGNRMQAYPVYDTDDLCNIDPNLDLLIKNTVQSLMGIEIDSWQANLRYIVSEEILNSKQNNRYGIKHTDRTQYAGVMYFEQTTTGGTAFFRTPLDNEPDIEIGSNENRCIIFNGQMFHAPSHDFSYDRRKSLVFFFNIK